MQHGSGGAIPRTVVYLDHTARWSGGEIALFRTLLAIDRERVTPVVVLAEEGPFADRLRESDIETHVLPLAGRVREVRKDTLGATALLRLAGAAFAFVRYAVAIARFARRRRAFVLHCNSLKADIYGALAGRLAGVPVIWHVRDHIDPSYLPAPAVKLFRWLAGWLPDAVLTNSESTLERLFPDGPTRERQRTRRAHVIHDGLTETELETPAPVSSGTWKHDPPRVGIVGRFVAWKGQHIFLSAALQLVHSGDNRTIAGRTQPLCAEFVLVGKPLFGEEAYEDGLHRQAAPLGDSVQFLGFRDDVPALLRQFDVFVHASTTPEPFGQVVIEAMAEGIPVIASNGGGIREIIEDGVSGLLTPMGDADALAVAIRSLLADPNRAGRMAAAGHERVHTLFTATRNARSVESVYDILGAFRRQDKGISALGGFDRAEPGAAARKGVPRADAAAPENGTRVTNTTCGSP
jgi:glycosyltransferase involved in cell wall biosynthesis